MLLHINVILIINFSMCYLEKNEVVARGINNRTFFSKSESKVYLSAFEYPSKEETRSVISVFEITALDNFQVFQLLDSTVFKEATSKAKAYAKIKVKDVLSIHSNIQFKKDNKPFPRHTNVINKNWKKLDANALRKILARHSSLVLK